MGVIPQFKCTGCGKLIALTAEDSGQRIVCSACGAASWAPLFRAQAGPEEAAVEARLVAALAEAQAAPPPPPAIPPRRARWPLALSLSLIWAGLLVAVVWVMARPAPDAWESANGSRLLALKGEADTLARDGKLADAHARYTELQQAVGLHEIRDPKLKAQLDEAQAAEKRIFGQLMDHVTPVGPPVVEAVQPIPHLSPSTRPVSRPAAIIQKPPPEPVLPPPATLPTVALTSPPQTRPAPVPQPAPEVEPVAPPIAVVQRPPTRKVPIPSNGVTDEEIGEAIQGLANTILSQFDGPRLKGTAENPYGPGLEVLSVYALLQAGQSISDERLNVKAKSMKAMLDHIRDLDLDGTSYQTYTRGLRATALSVYNRPEDREVLKKDLRWLITAHHQGGYSYGVTRSGWDNSNSQYGLLGAWSAAEVGGEVPLEYWAQVQRHWQECQYDDGEFGYGGAGRRDGRLSMTVAGIASLFVTHDYIDAPRFGAQVGRDPFGAHLAMGLKFLETNDNCIAGHSGGYSLYGLERVGLASGFKYFGSHDWYRELTERLINGGGAGWSMRGLRRMRFGGGDLVESSYTLLFLARGRHPILMNKLRFDGAWANRPRDVANLARFASRELERPLNWQVVPVSRDWQDWNDSPILYLASHQPITLKEGDYVKLRRFVDAGGMIFSQADGGAERFNAFVPELARKVFPGFEFKDLPQDHEIYTLNFQVDPKPRLKYLTNGSRILWVHSPEDLAMHWQLRAEKTRRNVFDLGLNLFIYAAGKSDLRNRLVSTYIPQPTHASPFTLRMARIKYGGLWDPEPMAFERFSRWFSFQTGYELVVSAVTPGELDPRTYPVAHLTGTVAWTPSDAETAALRRYVEDGGLLLIDACGGSAAFGNSVSSTLLPRAFAGARVDELSPNHPILLGKGDGMDPLKFSARPLAEKKLGRSGMRIEIIPKGRGLVLFTPADLTTGLLGTNTWGILGYKPAYCQSFLKNTLLWTADGKPEK